VAPVISPFGRRPRRTFALVIGLPAFLLYVLSAALVIVALGVMASEMNRLEQLRGVTAMHAALDSFLNDLSGAVSDEGTWDEAYLNVVVKPDPAWMDTTWGQTARLGQSYDNVLITDQAGTILFGENASGPIKGSIMMRYPTARTILHELDKGIQATGDATAVTHFATDPDGTVGLAAISIHKSDPGQLNVAREQRRILWIARHVTPGLLQDIAVRYQTPLATLADASADSGLGIVLTDADGGSAGTVAWIPDHPGDIAFNHAVLVASVVFFGIGLALVIGLGFLRRAIERRAKIVIAAQMAAIETAATSAVTAGVAAAVATDAVVEDSEANAIDGVNAADFNIEYQPILDLRSEELVGVEALLRWVKPDKTILTQEELSPKDRAKLLDRAGVIALRRVLSEVAPLIGLTLTLDVTPEQLHSGVYSEKVAGTMGATNFPARRLQLAVDAPLLPPASAIATSITELRRLGVSIALSEYTIDPHTAPYLDAKLADRVRLAVALTDGSGAAHDALLTASIEAARAAGLAVTVPGLERKEQAARLLRLGCREFQGNLLAKPIPIAALTQLALAPPKPAPVKKAG
jgi:EAL domain-containing protein (putative c-di-GMP-specific phosphodiesterase class I)